MDLPSVSGWMADAGERAVSHDPLADKRNAHAKENDRNHHVEVPDIDGPDKANAEPAGCHSQRKENQGRLELGSRELTQSKEGRRLHKVCRGEEEDARADIHVAIKVSRHDVELKGWRSRMRDHAGEARTDSTEDAKPFRMNVGLPGQGAELALELTQREHERNNAESDFDGPSGNGGSEGVGKE